MHVSERSSPTDTLQSLIPSLHSFDCVSSTSSEQQFQSNCAEFADYSDAQSPLFRVLSVAKHFPLDYCSNFRNFYNEKKNEQQSTEGES